MGWLGNTFGNDLGKVAPRQIFDSGSGYGVIEITGVYDIRGVGIIPVGTVVEGIIKPGQRADFNGKVGIIKSIESNHVRLSQASVGEKIGFSLSGVSKGDVVVGAKVRFS